MRNSTRKIIKGIAISLAITTVASFPCLFLAIWGVWDIKEYSFQTKEDALQENFFEKGWLPHFIPESSINIRVKRNIDINTSEGSFHIPANETNNFMNLLSAKDTEESRLGRPENYEELLNLGYNSVNCAYGDTVWLFMIDTKTGRCIYTSSMFKY